MRVLQGIPRVVASLDVFLVSGAIEEEHLRTLQAVFDRLEKAGLQVREEKCQLLVTYLGYQINAEGLHPWKTKCMLW